MMTTKKNELLKKLKMQYKLKINEYANIIYLDNLWLLQYLLNSLKFKYSFFK